MSSPKRVRISLWNREDISYCSCGDSKSVHAHCPCDVCDGKAVARSTEYHHWVATRDLIESQKPSERIELAMSTDFDEIDPSTSAHAQLQPVDDFGATDTCTCTVEESTGVVNEANCTTPTQTSEEPGEVLTCTSEETESSLAAQACTAAGSYI